MDVNNTKFHLLYGYQDWEPLIRETEARSGAAGSAQVYYDTDRHALGLLPRLYRFPKVENTPLAQRRGAAADRFGNWFVINEDRSGIIVHPANGEDPRRMWPVPGNVPASAGETSGEFGPAEAPALPDQVELGGLVVTTQQYLVAGVRSPGGIAIFDLYGGGPPVWFEWPEAIDFTPFDMAPRPDGGVWILDVDPDSWAEKPARYWALDRYFRVEHAGSSSGTPLHGTSEPFQPVAPGAEPPGEHYSQAPLTEAMAYEINLAHPVAIAALPDDTVLIMDADADTGTTRVSRYRYRQEIWRSDPVEDRINRVVDTPEEVAWTGHDMAFLLQSRQETRVPGMTGTLYLVGQDGNQVFAFTTHLGTDSVELRLQDKYFPLRRFQGKGLTASLGKIYYDISGGWNPVAEQPKPRYYSAGVLETSLPSPLDGKEPGCVWHRLLLDARIPPEADVLVESRAADAEADLADTPWRREPDLYRRGAGSEVPYYRPFSPDQQGKPGAGTWELLFQQATGRYLQLRLTLQGNGRLTPRIAALRAYYPRFSYLSEYLPAVYRDDESSASFLDRFLANLEGFYTEIEGKIAGAQVLFDERSVPPQYLDWLSSWFGTVLDPNYSDVRRRLFIRHAMELYRQRGTLQGLIRSVRLLLDPCPDDGLFEPRGIAPDLGGREQNAGGSRILRHNIRIVERFRVRQTPGVVFGDPTAIQVSGPAGDLANWTPARGAEPLHDQFRRFLEQQYPDMAALAGVWGDGDPATFQPDQILLSPVLPAGGKRQADWRLFVTEILGFTYAIPAPEDVGRYRKFLARKYRRISGLNEAYLTPYTSFSEIALPGEQDFPRRNPRLQDWIRFVSQILPQERSAHRFDVLIPVEPGTDITAQNERISLVRRIVQQEKPAHTEFDVKPYWAAFRVGGVRVGYDTLLDEGSRYVAILLGESPLAGGYLGYPPAREDAYPGISGQEASEPDRRL